MEGETDPGSQRRSPSQGVTGQASRGEQGQSADQESNQSGRGISGRYQGNSRPNLSSARKTYILLFFVRKCRYSNHYFDLNMAYCFPQI